MNPGTCQYLAMWRRKEESAEETKTVTHQVGKKKKERFLFLFLGDQVKKIFEKRKKEPDVSNVDEKGSEMVFGEMESLSHIHKRGFCAAVRTRSSLEWVEGRR